MNDENNNVLHSIGQISISTPLVAPAANNSDPVTRMSEDAVGETRQDTDDQPVQRQRFDASAAENVLSSLWRSPDQTHFIGTRDKQSGKFQNLAVPGISEAVAFAQASSALGLRSGSVCLNSIPRFISGERAGW